MESDKTQAREPEFDAFAENYDEALNEGLKLSGESKDFFAENRMKWVRSRLKESESLPSTALDFGCGTGSAAPFFFDILGIDSLVGMDPSEQSLEQGRNSWKDYPVEFVSDTQHIEEPLDFAFCNGVFHHIPPAQRELAVQSIFDSLSAGSCFAFWENNPWNPVTRYAMSRVPFDADAILVWPGEARMLLKNGGFEILHTDYVFFFPRFLAFLRRFEPLLKWLPLGGQYLVLCRKPVE